MTVHGEVVAELLPGADRRPTHLTPAQVLGIVQADPELRQLLSELDDSTDDLDPL